MLLRVGIAPDGTDPDATRMQIGSYGAPPSGILYAVTAPIGWRGSPPPTTIAVARSGPPVGAAAGGDYRFELSISRLPQGGYRLIVDWSDESSSESDHKTMPAAIRHAKNAVADDSLVFEGWTAFVNDEVGSLRPIALDHPYGT
jgi:hypothetical protein